MIHVPHFRQLIIRPALQRMTLYSPAAENLLLGTALYESRITYLKQINGPALGVFQIEPFTLNDVYENYLEYREEMMMVMDELQGHMEAEEAVVANLMYAAAVARLIYYRSPMPLPDSDDMDGLAHMYKVVYNTDLGRGTEAGFIETYNKYTKGE